MKLTSFEALVAAQEKAGRPQDRIDDSRLPADDIDWRTTTWEGARREQLRRWAELPLECVVEALEEMQRFAEALDDRSTAQHASTRSSAK